MTINPLNNISKIYLEEVAKKKKDNSYLETDFKKRQANNEKARKDLMKGPQMKNPHFEEKQLDPVGQEDADVDNDGDKDKSDKYLLKRRKAIGKAIAHEKKKKVSEQEEKIGGGNLKSLAKKAAKRIDADVDGDVDTNDPKSDEMGEFIPSPDGKKQVKTKVQRESFSNWRQDLREVMDDDGEEEKQVKEKKVKNTIKINPKISEAFEEIGAELIEVTEIEEDFDLEPIYEEFQNEGYQDDDIEEALEYAMSEASVTYGHDTAKRYKTGGMVGAVRRLAKQKLSSLGKKAKLKSAQAQVAAYNKGREVKQRAGDKVRGAKVGLKAKIKKVAQKVVDRMSEETAMQMSPQEVALQKKKATVDQQIAVKRKQALNKVQKEETELDERTRYAKETGKDYTTGNPSEKGGTMKGSAMAKVGAELRKTGGMMSSRKKAIQPQGKKKEKGVGL